MTNRFLGQEETTKVQVLSVSVLLLFVRILLTIGFLFFSIGFFALFQANLTITWPNEFRGARERKRGREREEERKRRKRKKEEERRGKEEEGEPANEVHEGDDREQGQHVHGSQQEDFFIVFVLEVSGSARHQQKGDSRQLA